MPTFPILYLRDDFTDNSIAAAWASSYANGSATKSEASSQARFALPNSTAGSHGAAYLTDGTYDLTGAAAFINVAQMVATGVAAQAFFDLIMDSSNRLRWIQESNTLKAQTIIAGVTTDRYSATWNATTYKYWRFSELSGTVYFESSSNGTSWTTRFSMAAPFAVTALSIQFGASCGNVASPGAFHVEEFNPILPALTTNWRWVRAEWPLTHRFRNVTLAIDTAGTAQGYLAVFSSVDVSGNPVSPVYYSGPLDKNGNLTAQSTQAAAQAMAVNLPLDGRWSLPAMVETRFVQLYARSIDGNSFVLREKYGRRLVQTDDIEAEAIHTHHVAAAQIVGDHIVAGTITADKMSVTSLSAITGNVGTLTGGTIDGVTIYAGGVSHPITLDSTGVTFTGSTFAYSLYNSTPQTLPRANSAYWTKISAGNNARLIGSDTGQALLYGERVTLAVPLNSQASYGVDVQSSGVNITGASLLVADDVNTSPTAFKVTCSAAVASSCLIETDGNAKIDGALNVGSASAAASNGQIAVQYDDSSTTSVPTALYLEHATSATPAAGFGVDFRMRLESSTTANQEAGLIRAEWATATHASRAARMTFYAYATGAQEGMRIEAGAAAKIGFLGSNAQAKPTVTGSRGGNAALASLLTALANYGLITDSSS